MICVKFTFFLRLASRLANPFGHPSQVRTQVLVLQTCVDLRRLASTCESVWPGLYITLNQLKSSISVLAALENLSDWMAPQPVPKGLMYKMDTCQVIYEPLGVSLVIGAWNYPAQLILSPLIGAIAAGMMSLLQK